MPEDVTTVINHVNWNLLIFEPAQRSELKDLCLNHLDVSNSVANLQTIKLLDSLQINNQILHIIFFALKKHHHSTAYYHQISIIMEKNLNELLKTLPNELSLNKIVPPQFKTWQHPSNETINLKSLNLTIKLPARYKKTDEVLDNFKIPHSKLDSNNPYLRTGHLLRELAQFKKGIYRNNEIAINWIELLIGINYANTRIRHQLINWYYQNRISTVNDTVIRMLYYYRQISLTQFKKVKK